MKIIKRRLGLSGAAAVAALLLLLYFLARKQYLLAVIFAGTAAIGFVIFACSYRAYTSARLIWDNRIIDICPATISIKGAAYKSARQVIACVLSPFGLLIGGNVYKFGRDGIRLYAIDIGETYISVDFGDEAKRWTAVLLHGARNQDALNRLAEQVAYETGVTPSLLDTNHIH